jgi:hypothetical protein
MAISGGYIPSLISTYTLEKGGEKVYVRRVNVEQMVTQASGQVVRECHGGEGGGDFFNPGVNEFKLNWMKCPIMDGVDTIKIGIFYKKSEEPKAEEHQFNVEYHNQETIKTDYSIEMNFHLDDDGGGQMRHRPREAEAEGKEEQSQGKEVDAGSGKEGVRAQNEPKAEEKPEKGKEADGGKQKDLPKKEAGNEAEKKLEEGKEEGEKQKQKEVKLAKGEGETKVTTEHNGKEGPKLLEWKGPNEKQPNARTGSI